MKVLVGQLSLLDLTEPVVRSPGRPGTTPSDKPAEKAATEVPGRRPASHSASTTPPTAEALLTTNEAAAHLRVHPRTVQRLVERGQLAAVHIGSAVRFDRQDVEALVAGVKERRSPPSSVMNEVRARRHGSTNFADRLRSQRHEHRAAQA